MKPEAKKTLKKGALLVFGAAVTGVLLGHLALYIDTGTFSKEKQTEVYQQRRVERERQEFKEQTRQKLHENIDLNKDEYYSVKEMNYFLKLQGIKPEDRILSFGPWPYTKDWSLDKVIDMNEMYKNKEK